MSGWKDRDWDEHELMSDWHVVGLPRVLEGKVFLFHWEWLKEAAKAVTRIARNVRLYLPRARARAFRQSINTTRVGFGGRVWRDTKVERWQLKRKYDKPRELKYGELY